MPADCEVLQCGVLAVGRCGCGRAFCASHAASDNGPVRLYERGLQAGSACVLCAANTPLVSVQRETAATERAAREAEARRGLPPMTTDEVIEYLLGRRHERTRQLVAVDGTVVAAAYRRRTNAPVVTYRVPDHRKGLRRIRGAVATGWILEQTRKTMSDDTPYMGANGGDHYRMLTIDGQSAVVQGASYGGTAALIRLNGIARFEPAQLRNLRIGPFPDAVD